MSNLPNKIPILIDEELKQQKEKEYSQEVSRIIGKEIASYGVKLPKIRKIAKNTSNNFQTKIGRKLVKS
jgi:hypothetical protein